MVYCVAWLTRSSVVSNGWLSAKLAGNSAAVTAGPCLSCGSIWSVFRDFPDFWRDQLPYCSGRGDSFAAGRAYSITLDPEFPPLVLTDYLLQDIADARKDLQAHNIS